MNVPTLSHAAQIAPPAEEPALEVDGLVKSYGKVVAVRGISFLVPKGQVVGLLGPNGAGKSTTIKVCLGLTRPTRGVVRVFGSTPVTAEARRRMGYSPETPYFYPFLTAEEILAFYAGLQGIESVRASVDRVLRATGLEAARSRKVGHFSKGMVQRLAVAQSLLGDPEILFLDEPSSGLDPEGRLEMRQIIQELKQSGKTILLSSHILSDIEAVCDRVIVIKAGRIVADRLLNNEMPELEVEVEVRALPEEALATLRRMGWNVQYDEPRLSVMNLQPGQEPELLSVLAEHRAQVYRLKRKQATLEDIYMEIMRKGGQEQ